MLDWDTAIKPLLQESGTPPKIEDVISVSDAIIENKTKLLESGTEEFYSIYVTLAGDFLSAFFNKLTRETVQKVAAACRVLIEYCVISIGDPTFVDKNRCMSTVMSLCSQYDLPSTDVSALKTMMKSVGVDMMARLMRKDAEESMEVVERNSISAFNLFSYLSESDKDIIEYKGEFEHLMTLNHRVFVQLASQHQLFASFSLLQPLQKFRPQFLFDKSENREPPALPNSLAEAHHFEDNLNECFVNIRLVADAASLELLKPSSSDQLEQYLEIVLTCLHIGVLVAVSRTFIGSDCNHEETRTLEQLRAKIRKNKSCVVMKDIVSIHEEMIRMLKDSTSSGSEVYQNFQTHSSWLILKGLKVINKISNKSKTKESNLFSLALVSLLTKQLRELVTCCDVCISEKEYDIQGSMHQITSPSQRFNFLTQQFDLLEIYINSVQDAFRSIFISSSSAPNTTSSADIMTFEDDDQCPGGSDANSEASESDPVLGRNLLTIFACDANDEGTTKPADKISKIVKKRFDFRKGLIASLSNVDSNFEIFFPELVFPNFIQDIGILKSCDEIIGLLTEMLESSKPLIQLYFINNMTSQILIRLFNICSLIDQQPSLTSNREGFSIFDFFRKLLAGKSLEISQKTRIEDVIFDQLFDEEDEKLICKTPMQLSLFTRMLVSRQEDIKKTFSDEDEVNTLNYISRVLEALSFKETPQTQVPVEVLQLVCFLFHTLTDDNKAQQMIKTFRALISWKDNSTPSNTSPISLCLLVEYFLYNFSKVDEQLVQHVIWNLFNIHNLMSYEKNKTFKEMFTSYKKFTSFKHDSKPPKTSDDNITAIELIELRSDVDDSSCEVSQEALSLLTSLDDECEDLFACVVYFLKTSLSLSRSDPQTESRFNVASYGFQLFWRLVLILPLSDHMQQILDNGVTDKAEELLVCIEIITRSSQDDKWKLERLCLLTEKYFGKFYSDDIIGEFTMEQDARFPASIELIILDYLSHQLFIYKKKMKKNFNIYQKYPKLQMLIVNAVVHFNYNLRSHMHRLARKHSSCELPSSGLQSYDYLISNINLNLLTSFQSTFKLTTSSWFEEELSRWKDYYKAIKVIKTSPEFNTTLASHFQIYEVFGLQSDDVIIAVSLLMAQQSLYNLCDDVLVDLMNKGHLGEVCFKIFPVITTVSCIDSEDFLPLALDKMYDTNESEYTLFHDMACFYVVKTVYELLTNCFKKDNSIGDEQTAVDLIRFLTFIIEDSYIQRALRHFLAKDDEIPAFETDEPFHGNPRGEKGSLVRLLDSVKDVDTELYASEMLIFVATICNHTFTSPSLSVVCDQLKDLKLVHKGFLSWVPLLDFTDVEPSTEDMVTSMTVVSALQTLCNFAANPDSEVTRNLCTTLLQAVLPVHSDQSALDSLYQLKIPFIEILITLADANSGSGHPILLRFAIKCLNASLALFGDLEAAYKLLVDTESKLSRALSATCHLLLYVADVLKALGELTPQNESCVFETDDEIEMSFETEFSEEESSSTYDSQTLAPNDDDQLWNRLCTYSVTQKKFINQHWYHCHTCHMVDGVGVCTICAKVCHKNHDLSYAKFGSFFCDCGAKEPKVCKALVKRLPGSDKTASGVSAFSVLTPEGSATALPSTTSINRKDEKQSHDRKQMSKLREASVDLNVESSRSELLRMLEAPDSALGDDVITTLIQLVETMTDLMMSDPYKLHSVNSMVRALMVMSDLREKSKKIELIDNLLIPTLGSQEGAFENVKPNYAGEQGQTIRQLVNNKTIRRVSMCCLAPSNGTQQHLAVSHDKNKITLLQLFTLLKQADASKRKLTLTRLSTTTMPFTVVSISANLSNDEVLAVCGLRDCHVLTFASSPATSVPSGSVLQHLVLHPELTINNYIIRSIWLPASSSLLALITAEFIKIYDLAKDVLSPAYYLLIPTGKIKSATFIGGLQSDEETYVLTMSTNGFIYCQQLTRDSLAVHGTFYMTNILTVPSNLIKENGGQLGGGGLSIFYSHVLQLVFFSYQNGRNFSASLTQSCGAFHQIFPIDYKPSTSNTSNRASALYEWSEVAQHPGLVTCLAYNSGCPVVLMVEPDSIQMQEIKLTSSKAKIQDMVAVRHISSTKDGPSERTTVIVLCDDGSLRIYLVSTAASNFWLHPNLKPNVVLGKQRTSKRFTSTKSQTSQRRLSNSRFRVFTSGFTEQDGSENDQNLPVDFFESCQAVGANELELGGDLLRVYNTAQLKNRLTGHGTNVVFKSKYDLTIKLTKPNVIIAGLRFLIGGKGGKSAPRYISIAGSRIVNLATENARVATERWFDVPLTTEESMKHQAELLVKIGSSDDRVVIINGIRIYSKSKEVFGISDDDGKTKSVKENDAKDEDDVTCEVDASVDTSSPQLVGNQEACNNVLSASLLAMERLIHTNFKESVKAKVLASILKTSFDLLAEPLPSSVQYDVKRLLSLLFKHPNDFYCYQDLMVVKQAYESFCKNDLGVESFQRMLIFISHIARKRPFNLLPPQKLDESFSLDEMKFGLEAPVSIWKDFAFVSEDFQTNFIVTMVSAFWRLFNLKPRNKNLLPPSLPGLTQVDITVRILIDVIHAISGAPHLNPTSSSSSSAASSPDTFTLVSNIYFKLLTHPNPRVSYSTKSALVRLLQTKPVGLTTAVSRTTKKGADSPHSSRSLSPSTLQRPLERPDETVPNPLVDQSLRTSNQDALFDVDEVEDEDVEDITLDDSIDLEDFMSNQPNIFYSRMEGNESAEAEPMIVDASSNNAAASRDSAANNDQQMLISRLQQGLGRDQGVAADNFNLGVLQAIANDGQESMIIDEIEMEEEDLENALLGQDEDAMMELAIALSLRQEQEQPPAPIAPWEDNPIHEMVVERSENQGAADGYFSSDGSDAMDTSVATPLLESQLNQTSAVTSGSSDVTVADDDVESVISDQITARIRFAILKQLFLKMEDVEKIGGEAAIPYFQVLVMLIQTLDLSNPESLQLYRKIITSLMDRLKDRCNHEDRISNLNPQNEVFVLMLRFLNVLMVKTGYEDHIKSDAEAKVSTTTTNTTTSTELEPTKRPTVSLSASTVSLLVEEKILSLCFYILQVLYNDYWKNNEAGEVEEDTKDTQGLLRAVRTCAVADMSPFFVEQHSRRYSGEIFLPYHRLITEMALQLAYQVRKQVVATPDSDPMSVFSLQWRSLLSDIMLFANTPHVVRRRTRKLLLHITGSKDKYRQERDFHALASYLKKSSDICKWSSSTGPLSNGPLNLSYDDLIELVETVKKWNDIARARPLNWQKFCLSTPDCLHYLLHVSVHLDEIVAAIALKLLLSATITTPLVASDNAKSSKKKLSKSSSKDGKMKEQQQLQQFAVGLHLSTLLLNGISDVDLSNFIRHFLLELNATSMRWSAHSLLLNIFKNTSENLQLRLLSSMWSLWPFVVQFGKKSSQFVDLLGYLTLKSNISEENSRQYSTSALQVLKQSNRLIASHHNAILYNQLSVYVNFDGYYLENNPCMVCNQIESPFSNIKMMSIRTEVRYTTAQIITKLVGSYAIQKATIKVTDIKRTKMIRTALLYYNNKKVSAIVDLKNKPSMWNKAKSVTVPQGETDIVFDLPLPVIATNLMVEFKDFYENISASMETLQCPRCSASVQANPGVCGNCGENVFQCHKCRSINYDEKDPFLCNMCGFSKYAKFEITFKAKTCCAVDTIDNNEGRKKMVESVVTLLGKAENTYRLLCNQKPVLEKLLLEISSSSSEARLTTDKTISTTTKPPSAPTTKSLTTSVNGHPITFAAVAAGATVTGASTASNPTSNNQLQSVNNNIQLLAKKYCQDCKGMFNELVNIVRTVLASRNELLEFDRRQRLAVGGQLVGALETASVSSIACSQSASDCYGCASAISEQCIILLGVLSHNKDARPHLIDQGLVQELVTFNMKRTEHKIRKQVHDVIGQLVRNNPTATKQLNNILFDRIINAVDHHNDELPSTAVVSEMQLLTSMLTMNDDLWQMRLRTVMKLFQSTINIKSPSVVENITLPCLHIFTGLVSNPQGKDEKIVTTLSKVSADFKSWMESDCDHEFDEWKKNVIMQTFKSGSKVGKNLKKEEIRSLFLQKKYSLLWKDCITTKKTTATDVKLITWNPVLRSMLFCPTSISVRQAACSIINNMSRNPARKSQVLDLLTSYLEELGEAGEAANEFMNLYQDEIAPISSKIHLVVRGALPQIGSLIQCEIKKLSALEKTTLNLKLQQGYALKELTDLLFELVQEVPQTNIKSKKKLIRIVLNSYLSLRRLVLQRTNLVDSAQELMLVLLEDLTSGTEDETRSFMALCIEAIKKQDPNDHQTPQFIFERLANIIYPEETDVSEFFLSLDKCPLQEEFLQGRMVGNPYSSNTSGLGPLMRDVKNKICRDCDLIALLEDDSGMELLVSNKIISLDLSVRDVYKKIWLSDHGEDDAMHVVYRMRGLLGEATEDMIERLDSDKTEDDEEEIYKLASVLGECGGIEVMLTRLEAVKNVKHGRQLVDVILKLLSYAVKLQFNRRYLAQPSLKALNVLLGSLNLSLQAGEDGVIIVEQLLEIMLKVLHEAALNSSQSQTDIPQLSGDKDRLTLLLSQIDSEFVQSHPSVLQGTLRIIPFFSFGDIDLMQMLIDHFIASLNFDKYDKGDSDENTIYLNCFCEIVAGIQVNVNGDHLKDLMIKNKIVEDALIYLNKHIPDNKDFESDQWKSFTQRKGVPLCLRMLTGLCSRHQPTQELLKDSIPGLHRIEQISSEEGIGTHAENVLENLKEHPEVSKLVNKVRRETRAEKKRKAMEVRNKELVAFGMLTNEKGQMKSTSKKHQFTELVEETGLTCNICREGYKSDPKKVLGIYTYTRRCALEEFESKGRKQQGYSSVSHFNVIHYDCHTTAVRSARGREEWDSALLQNGNTKCNGLLPLWGPDVLESAFAACLARHNTYIQEATGSQREPTFGSTVHDLKLLLLRFSNEKSFSEETGGGGKQSNINFVPYLIHTGLYVINTTRSESREEKALSGFLTASTDKWVESSYEVEGPLYFGALMTLLGGKEKWMKQRIYLLKRIIVTCQARHESKTPISKLSNISILDFNIYKPYLLFWALLDTIINVHFKFAPSDASCIELANYIRHNDSQILEQSEKVLRILQDDLLPCNSALELMDVLGTLGDVPDFKQFVVSIFSSFF